MHGATAIETKYKEYRFRSRLEARWAVFFDEIGVVWEYEKEGFRLPSGRQFLPDFFFPEWNLFAEIKPEENPNDQELCREFRNSVGQSCC